MFAEAAPVSWRDGPWAQRWVGSCWALLPFLFQVRMAGRKAYSPRAPPLGYVASFLPLLFLWVSRCPVCVPGSGMEKKRGS